MERLLEWLAYPIVRFLEWLGEAMEIESPGHEEMED